MSTIFANNLKNISGGNNVNINQLSGIDTAGSILVTGEGGSNTTNLQQGLIKAFIHHTGDSPTTNDSFNVASLTDNDTGDYTYTWTNAFGNTFPSVSGMSTEDGTIGYVTLYFDRSWTKSGANLRVQGIDQGDSYDDGAYSSVMAAGDLA